MNKRKSWLNKQGINQLLGGLHSTHLNNKQFNWLMGSRSWYVCNRPIHASVSCGRDINTRKNSFVCHHSHPYWMQPVSCLLQHTKLMGRQIMKKNSVLRSVFISFKKAYDSVRREVLYKILIEFGIPRKLVRLIKMSLTGTYSKVRVGKNVSDRFPIRNGWKQGDAL